MVPTGSLAGCTPPPLTRTVITPALAPSLSACRASCENQQITWKELPSHASGVRAPLRLDCKGTELWWSGLRQRPTFGPRCEEVLSIGHGLVCVYERLAVCCLHIPIAKACYFKKRKDRNHAVGKRKTSGHAVARCK